MTPIIQAAAEHSNETIATPFVFDELLRKIDKPVTSPTMHVDCFCFDLDGIGFEVRRVPRPQGHRFLIVAALGYVPFSIEDAVRREALLTILSATRSLPRARFAVIPLAKSPRPQCSISPPSRPISYFTRLCCSCRKHVPLCS